MAIPVVAGVVGAVAAALAFPDKSLGSARNVLAGLAGGCLGAAGLVLALGFEHGTGEPLQGLAGGGMGGAALTYLIGTLRNHWRR